MFLIEPLLRSLADMGNTVGKEEIASIPGLPINH